MRDVPRSGGRREVEKRGERGEEKRGGKGKKVGILSDLSDSSHPRGKGEKREKGLGKRRKKKKEEGARPCGTSPILLRLRVHLYRLRGEKKKKKSQEKKKRRYKKLNLLALSREEKNKKKKGRDV